jgi:tripartite-type tricarboxylate transporter receptor subunit TctC
MKKPIAAAMFAGAAFVALHASAQAAESKAEAAYPERPVRILVPFPPGQTVDIVGRILSERYTEAFGKQFLIDNRSGAAGTIGTALAARAAPDGYTMLIVSNGTTAGNTALWKEKLPYNVVKDFAPVINLIATPQLLVASPSLHYRTVQDIVKDAKANPGKISYALPGVGNSSHLAMEMLRARAGIDIVPIPYQGSPPAFVDIMSGRVPIMFEAASGVLVHVRSGKIRAIATGGPARAVFLPDVPTVAESGYPGFSAVPWVGMVAPAGTPKAIVAKLFREADKLLQTPEGKARIINMGMEPLGMDPAQFAAHIKVEIERWTKVVQDAGIKLE